MSQKTERFGAFHDMGGHRLWILRLRLIRTRYRHRIARLSVVPFLAFRGSLLPPHLSLVGSGLATNWEP